MPLPPEFDLAGPGYFADPHAAFQQLREAAPVWFSPRLKRWIVTRYDDVQTVLRDPHTFSSNVVPRLPPGEQGGPLQEFERLSALWLFFADPPAHAAPRRALTQALSAVAGELSDERLAAWSEDLLQQALESPESDLIAGFAHPLAARVVGQALCPGDLPDFLEGCRAMEAASRAPRDPKLREAGLNAMAEVTELVSVLARQAGTGRSPVVDALAAGSAERVTWRRLASQTLVLVFAGVETTQNLIGTSLVALATHPAARDLLAEQPALLPQAVEECLRFDPPVLGVVRRAMVDVELGGERIAAGDEVAAMVAAANRDPARFPRPDDFDVRRAAGGHLAFGGGVHYCAGAAWSRRTAEHALRASLRLLPHWHFGPLAWRSHDPLVRGLVSCRLQLAASALPDVRGSGL